jgi:hypothetical protein
MFMARPFGYNLGQRRASHMFAIDELLMAVEDYQQERMSLEAFEQWFEENSAMEFAEAEVNRMRAAVDAALGEYHFDHIGEQAFRKELANAVRPFGVLVERPAPDIFLVKSRSIQAGHSSKTESNGITRRKPPARDEPLAWGTATSYQPALVARA